jgi:hypothetical protein
MDDRIADLLEKWEEAADQGHELPVEELCRECPECVDELRWRITALKKTNWTKKPLTDEPAFGTKPADFGLPETLVVTTSKLCSVQADSVRSGRRSTRN